MQRILIIVGIIVLVIGFLWPWLVKLPIGRLPGDIIIDRPGFKLYLPITTAIIASIIISLVLWFLRK
jgi:hypothetical protein